MFSVTYNNGEKRRIHFSAYSQKSTDVIVISSANWELIDKASGEAVDSGNCEVEGRDVYCLVEFAEKGLFYVVVTVEIPPEIIIERLNVSVV